jgi:hypothetical protein
VTLDNGKTIVVEKQSILPGIWLDGEKVYSFSSLLNSQCGTRPLADHGKWVTTWYDDILPFETINPGLTPYY